MSVRSADVAAARERIARHVRTTPVLDVETDGRLLSLKLESLQVTGSFKPRGAFNKLLSSDRSRGCIAASGGNHGLAVAYAASSLGVAAEIVVPSVISAAKLDRLRRHPVDVVVHGDVYADALAYSETRAEETGRLMIHAYDDPHVIAGQGTVGAELREQVPEADAVVVAVGGGGLASGIVTALEGSAVVVAVETEGTSTLHRSLHAGKRVEVEASGVAADALGAAKIGAHCLPLLAGVESVVVSDADLSRAQRWLWDTARVVAEPAGAAGLAAVLAGQVIGRFERPVVVVCGANTSIG